MIRKIRHRRAWGLQRNSQPRSFIQIFSFKEQVDSSLQGSLWWPLIPWFGNNGTANRQHLFVQHVIMCQLLSPVCYVCDSRRVPLDGIIASIPTVHVRKLVDLCPPDIAGFDFFFSQGTALVLSDVTMQLGWNT